MTSLRISFRCGHANSEKANSCACILAADRFSFLPCFSEVLQMPTIWNDFRISIQTSWCSAIFVGLCTPAFTRLQSRKTVNASFHKNTLVLFKGLCITFLTAVTRYKQNLKGLIDWSSFKVMQIQTDISNFSDTLNSHITLIQHCDVCMCVSVCSQGQDVYGDILRTEKGKIQLIWETGSERSKDKMEEEKEKRNLKKKIFFGCAPQHGGS